MTAFQSHRVIPAICAAACPATVLLIGVCLSGPLKAELSAVLDRRPTAISQTEDQLFVATGRGGTIATISKQTLEVARELAVAGTIVDLQPCGPSRLIAVDQANHRVILLKEGRGALRVVTTADVPKTPTHARVHPGRDVLTVTSLWARQLTFLSIGQSDLKRLKTIDLPFAPRLQMNLPDQRRLVVADAFGGKLAIIDIPSRELLTVRSIQGHNIRGLAISSDHEDLLIAHQMMNPDVPTERARVFWGTVMSNLLRGVTIAQLTNSAGDDTSKLAAEPIHHWSLIPLGTSGNASGDPGSIAISPAGDAVVALSGVDEVAVRNRRFEQFTRISVQRRPTATIIDSERRRAYVANQLSGSVSVIDLDAKKAIKHISLGPRPAATGVSRGESHFFDARLSLDGWFSCHSCHTDGHTSGLRNDNFGDDNKGAPKHILSLRGVANTGPWAWNGKQPDLQEQIAKSIELTMRGDPTKQSITNQARDIVSYIRTLPLPVPLDIARDRVDHTAVRRGEAVFQTHRCNTCHRPPLYTTAQTYDVGLEDELGTRKFNPPSLRSVSQKDRYFHDNRARSLEEVFVKFKHPRGSSLPASELADLLHFLRQL